MLLLQVLKFLLVSLNHGVRGSEEPLPTVSIILFPFHALSALNLFLQLFRVLVEARLSKILSLLLHLKYRLRVVNPVPLYSAVLDRDPEFVKFELLSLFQFHLDKSRLVLVLWKDYVVPFVC